MLYQICLTLIVIVLKIVHEYKLFPFYSSDKDINWERIALRVDKDVLEWYRSQGMGCQTRMNAVLKAYRDATV